jgi:hypothetical protein
MWVMPADAAAIERVAAERTLDGVCAPSGSRLADALAALVLAPALAPAARFPLVACRLVEETPDEWVGTSSGVERRPRVPTPVERIVHVAWVISVRPEDEPTVREYTASHYDKPVAIESAVDDLWAVEYPDGWWDECEFEIRDYTFDLVT